MLGLDPGSRRVGVAVSDSSRTLAFPRDALEVDEGLVARVRALAEEEGADEVVVGRPLNLTGEPTASTAAADELAAAMARDGSFRVVRHDERLTTVEASRGLAAAGHSARAQRGRVDSAAAVVMLQSYLDGRRA